MFVSQQLAPNILRISCPRPGSDGDRLPDPAIGDWGRARLESSARHEHADLASALAGFDVPLVALGYDDHAGVDVRVELRDGVRLYGAYDADAHGLDRRGDHVHLVTELHPRGTHRMVGTACDRCDSRPSGDDAGLSIGADSNYGELLVPFVASSDGWAIYVSNAWHDAQLDLGERDPGSLLFTAQGGWADVYLFTGARPLDAVRAFTRLTGHQPMPPSWALGFLQSRFGYESFDHVHDVLDRFEREQLPVHAVVFDVQWLEQHVNLRWDPTNFPNPAANLARIGERGVRRMVITEPGTAAAASNHGSGVARDAFAIAPDGSEFDSQQWYAKRGIEGYRDVEPSTGALLNVFREDAADWWYEQHVPLLRDGVDAWWIDLNEPEDVTPDVRFPKVDWPAARDHLDGDEVRGNFAIAQQRLFTRRDRATTTRRPFLLSRSGSAGSQRYGAAPWTGDVGATWHDLRVQARLVLNAGMSGLPLSGCDVGGFNGDPGPELFVRWMQLGSVLPIFRAHGYMADREPWSQGVEVLEAIRPSLVLRAQLLPSIVTWTWLALRAGEPLVRPMFAGPLGAGEDVVAAHWADERWHDVEDQWYFGPLLAAPVVEEGAGSRRVELPAGDWVDIATGARVEGGRAIEVDAPLDVLPLFLPGDLALVADPAPLAGRGQAWPPSELEVWAWSEVASGLLYLDDGITRMHEQGAYCLERVAVRDGSVEVERLGGSFPASRLRLVDPAPGRIAVPASR